MSEEFLNRGDAPFEDKIWEQIDTTVQSVASRTLSARKLLHTEGPYGVGLKFVPEHDQKIDEEGDLTVSSAGAVPLAFLVNKFSLNSRDLDQYASSGIMFDMKDLVSSVLALADKEDKLIFYGSNALGVQGITNSPGVLKTKLKPWKKIGDATENVISAIEQLDKAGFHGPYSLALAPSLYNSLLKRYPQEEVLELEHLRALVSEGIVKAPVLNDGGVLINYGPQFASIALGQDLMTGFEGPEGRDYIFVLSESVALRINIPRSICILQPGD
ncbi:MAG: family 1 encapsulin nanocompartment shell protein [Chitinispirillaceae bacterium]